MGDCFDTVSMRVREKPPLFCGFAVLFTVGVQSLYRLVSLTANFSECIIARQSSCATAVCIFCITTFDLK